MLFFLDTPFHGLNKETRLSEGNQITFNDCKKAKIHHLDFKTTHSDSNSLKVSLRLNGDMVEERLFCEDDMYESLEGDQSSTHLSFEHLDLPVEHGDTFELTAPEDSTIVISGLSMEYETRN